jgi:hypothetical protein
MIQKEVLMELYINQGKSALDIAKGLNCSENKVRYWMHAHKIGLRNISEAIYLKCNPNGDPFRFGSPRNIQEAILYGIGVGLYWGEGTKADKNSVRLGNTDSKLIKSFIKFLIKFFQIEKKDLKFGLQLFCDINETDAVNFWTNELKISKQQFYKVTITKSVSKGTYRKKSKYGVLTVYYHNKKMRDLLINLLPKN